MLKTYHLICKECKRKSMHITRKRTLTCPVCGEVYEPYKTKRRYKSRLVYPKQAPYDNSYD